MLLVLSCSSDSCAPWPACMINRFCPKALNNHDCNLLFLTLFISVLFMQSLPLFVFSFLEKSIDIVQCFFFVKLIEYFWGALSSLFVHKYFTLHPICFSTDAFDSSNLAILHTCVNLGSRAIVSRGSHH